MRAAPRRCIAEAAKRVGAGSMSETDARGEPSAGLALARGLRRAARGGRYNRWSPRRCLEPGWCLGTRAVGRPVKVFPYLSIH
jgi:hypothetical protein